MEIKKSDTSIFEHPFTDSDILRGCRFFLPNSIPDRIRRVTSYFGYKRKDINLKKFKAVLFYLSKKGIIKNFNLVTNQPNHLPPRHEVKISYSERVYGYSSEYGKPTGINLAISLGELLERYFTFKKVKSGSFFEVFIKKIKTGVPLELFNGYLREQGDTFPELLRQDQTAYEHSICTKLSTGERFLIPSQFVYWGFNDQKESVLLNRTTNGCGAFYTREEAILSGLYELIQRDNFSLMWLAKETKNKIDIHSIPPETEIGILIEKIQSRGIEIHFIVMERDIPLQSIGCLVLDIRNNYPVAAFGGAAGHNIQECLKNSLEEAMSVLNKNITNDFPFDIETYKPFIDKNARNIERKERLSLWKGDFLKNLDFLYAGEKMPLEKYKKGELVFSNKKEELLHMIKLLEKKGPGYEVYVHDVKSKILKNLGYHVVRVIVPRLFPLYLRESEATLSSERLAEALGINKENIKLSMLNPYPHPFP